MGSENNNGALIVFREEKLIEEKNFVLKHHEKNYEIKIQLVELNKEPYIRITAKKEKEIINYSYKVEMNEDDFKKQDNILLRLFDNIQKIYQLILGSFKENKISIKDIKEKVCFILIIKENIISYSEPLTFEINLKKNNCNNNDIIEMLCNKINELEQKNYMKFSINELEEENNNMKFKINELEKDNNNIKSKMNELSEGNNNLKLQVNKLKEENNNLESKMNELEKEKNSLKAEVNKLKEAIELNTTNYKIINNKKELKFIENRLLKIPGRENGEITLVLKYRMTQNGDSIKTYHSICNNIPYNLILIKTSDGARFGGYTDKAWTSSNSNIKDNNSFCFSLSNNKIYNLIKNSCTIHDYDKNGPNFCNLFSIGSNNSLKNGNCSKNSQTFSGLEKDYEISGGSQNFTVLEFEFYQVKFE